MKVPLGNTQRTYGLIAQALHWLVAAGIAVQFVWAWRIDETESIRAQFTLVNQHKSIGMTVLALVVVRLFWRAFNGRRLFRRACRRGKDSPHRRPTGCCTR